MTDRPEEQGSDQGAQRPQYPAYPNPAQPHPEQGQAGEPEAWPATAPPPPPGQPSWNQQPGGQGSWGPGGPAAPPPPPGQGWQQPGQAWPTPAQGWQQPGWQPRQTHGSATLSLVLGLIGLVGGFACYVPFFVAPFAWWTGAKARREIDRSQGRLDGRGMAVAGMVLGIIGTVLLVLALSVVVILIVVAINDPSFFDDDGY